MAHQARPCSLSLGRIGVLASCSRVVPRPGSALPSCRLAAMPGSLLSLYINNKAGGLIFQRVRPVLPATARARPTPLARRFPCSAGL